METSKDRWQVVSQLPLLWTSLAFLLGIALARHIGAPGAFWAAASAAGLAALLGLWRRLTGEQRLLLLAACALALGALRYQAAQPTFGPQNLAFYNDASGRVSVRGVLSRPPVYRDGYVELWLQARALTVGGASFPVQGQALARVNLGGRWVYGDVVQVSGRLRTPTDGEDFSYRDYLARQRVYSEMPFAQAVRTGGGQGAWAPGLLYAIRTRSVELLHQLYPDPVAGLLAGILLGDETGISPALKAAFNDTGTRHIVAISGFNISIIAGLCLALFVRRLGRQRGTWLAAAAILAYTLLVGAQASILRAAIMGLVALAAQLSGRDQLGINTLAFTAALMALFNPLVLGDVGFQLSFTATLGLIVYGERLRNWANAWLERRLPEEWAQRLKGPLYDYVLLTLAAQVLTLPLLLHHFGRLSLVSLPANVLILPLQPAVMVIGGLSLLAGAVWSLLGQALALLAWPAAMLTIRIVELFASPPWAAYNVAAFTAWMVFLYYLVVVLATIPPVRKLFKDLQLRPLVPALALAAFSFWSWGLASSSPDHLLHITLLDVEGEAVLIRTPAGRNLLINGGPSAVELSSQLGRHLPIFARQLDWLLVLGERPEQIRGLQTGVERLQVQQAAWATLWPSDEYKMLLNNLGDADLALTELQLGQQIDLGEGVTLQVIGLGSRGATVLLSWEDFQALLPFGLDREQMQALQSSPIAGVELLLLADAGYPAFNSAAWLASVDAQVHWLSADGEISADLLRALAGRALLPAAELGWLQVSTDGSSMWVSAQRGWARQNLLMQP